MYKVISLLSLACHMLITIKGDVETVLNNPDAINIKAVGVNNDLIWTDEKDMVTKYLPSKAKKNGKATGFRDIILENIFKVGFERIMEKIRNPHLFEDDLGVTDPMPLAEKINMEKEEDLYTIDMKTGEMQIGGFGDMKMDYIRVVRHFGLKDIKVSLRFGGNLQIFGNYTLKGQAIGILPVTGDGDFSIAINGAEISMISYAVMNHNGKNEAEKKKIIVKNLEAQVGYKELDFKFDNLMGGGIVGSTINLVINAMGEGIIESQRQMLISVLKNQFHNYVASYL